MAALFDAAGPWLWQCEHVVDTHIEGGRKVLEEIVAELARRHWGQRDCFSVHLSLDEALVNAIRHGNRSDPHKHVTIRGWLAANLLRVEITDEGAGFDVAALPDPTAPEPLDLPCGRGVMLMRAFMSRVEFRQHGRQVILEKDRQPPPMKSHTEYLTVNIPQMAFRTSRPRWRPS